MERMREHAGPTPRAGATRREERGQKREDFLMFLTWDVHLVVDLAVAVDISPRG